MRSISRVFVVFILGGMVFACGNKAIKTQRGNIITGHEPVNICEGKSASMKDVSYETDDRNAIPCIITQPRYPRKAAMNFVSGFVEFELTVKANGKAANITVVKSVPEGVFEKEALKAIKKWKFKPRMENGVAVSQNNMKYTMEFKMVK
mgnify:CR=1 FL=1